MFYEEVYQGILAHLIIVFTIPAIISESLAASLKVALGT